MPFLADICVVELVGNDGRLEPVAVAHVDSTQERWLREFAVDSGVESPANALQALRCRRPVILNNVTEANVERLAEEEGVSVNPRTPSGIACARACQPLHTIIAGVVGRRSKRRPPPLAVWPHPSARPDGEAR